MATRQEQIEFIKTVYPAAYSLFAAKDSINPVFVTAQAALETGWKIKGVSNNIFGITKGASWTGRTELVLTTEVFKSNTVSFAAPERVVSITPTSDGRFSYRVWRLFRAYDSLEDCLDDHLSVLRGSGYSDAYPYRKDSKEFARRIVDDVGAVYATSPSYAATLCSVIDTVNVRINEIKGSLGAPDVFFRQL